jgi:endonuclease/exonuclease/phosphatase family metal-dependent hydrolase
MARTKSAEMIIELVAAYAKADADGKQSIPVVLAGDFNSEPTQEAYTLLSRQGSPVQDVRLQIPTGQHYGFADTFTGFDDWDGPSGRIDFVFVSKNVLWKPIMYSVLPNKFDRLYISDHRAVVADIGL